MRLKVINILYGTKTINVKGTFPERVLNIAKENGIFIQKVFSKSDGEIEFTVSFEGAKKLFSLALPPTESICEVDSAGLRAVTTKLKNRVFLFICPFVIFLFLFLSTFFIWNVNIIDATYEEELHLAGQLKALGVHRGAFKFSIDQSEVKKELLLNNPDLLWVWVDIKGSGAIVKFAKRTPVPEVFQEDEGYSLVATKDAVITKIIARQGRQLVFEGDRVKKGDVLIEGVTAKNSEEVKLVHATGQVKGSVLHEKSVKIPKTLSIRTPTGEKTQHLTIFFSNFPVKLFINSSILYNNYDIIEYNRKLSCLPVTFHKKEYSEVTVSYCENDTEGEIEKKQKEYLTLLKRRYSDVKHIKSLQTDCGDYILLTISALCEEDIAKERSIYLGENNRVLFN